MDYGLAERVATAWAELPELHRKMALPLALADITLVWLNAPHMERTARRIWDAIKRRIKR